MKNLKDVLVLCGYTCIIAGIIITLLYYAMYLR